MKKAIFLSVTLSVITLAAVVAFTHTYSPQKKLLRENVAAKADCSLSHGGSVIFECKGAGKCDATKLGYSLTCDAKEVKQKPGLEIE